MNELWYLGVDVAGASNTWCVGLRRVVDGGVVAWGPHRQTLEAIVHWARERRVLAVAIDAQLSASLSDENGFRACDLEMRKLLPASAKTWVASINSLMAVPVRGRVLAEALAPMVGTVLETHPRFALWSVLGRQYDDDVAHYKKGETAAPMVARLATAWMETFGVKAERAITDEGELDALVAATVAMTYHREPERLYWPQQAADVRGAGPFVSISSPRLSESKQSNLET